MISFDVLSLISSHLVVSGVVASVFLAVMAGFPYVHRVYAGYVLALVVALVGGLQVGKPLYFYAFAVGFLTAFTEIIGKFTDEPIKALGTVAALFYHVSNGLVSAFALWVLSVSTAMPMSNAFDQMKAVLTAGLGSMLIMRSKLFEAKIKDENVSFGPEQVIKVFFNYMEKAIDRVRSQSRIDFVTTKLKNIDCSKVIPYVVTMLDAPQALDKAAKDELKSKMERIASEAPADAQYKSYRLGFLLLNEMGENLVSRVFDDPRPEWLIAAEKASDKETLLSRLPFVGTKDYVFYFAYGKSMSLDELVKRLHWNPSDVKELLTEKPRPCTVNNYRLEFSGPCGNGANSGQGCANLVPADGSKVWGVLLKVPKGVLDFLDAAQRGYHQKPVKCEMDGKPIDAICFAADPIPGLLPTKEYVDAMVAAASEQSLDATYIGQLRKTRTLQSEVPAVTTL